MTAEEKFAKLELEIMTLRVRAELFEKFFGRMCVLTFREALGLRPERLKSALLHALSLAQATAQAEIRSSPESDEEQARQLRAVDAAVKELQQSFAYFSDEPE